MPSCHHSRQVTCVNVKAVVLWLQWKWNVWPLFLKTSHNIPVLADSEVCQWPLLPLVMLTWLEGTTSTVFHNNYINLYIMFTRSAWASQRMSNSHCICILIIVEAQSRIILYKEIHLNSISTVKYIMEQWILLLSAMVSKMKKLKKKEVMYIEKCLKELDLEVMEVFLFKLWKQMNNIYLFIQ